MTIEEMIRAEALKQGVEPELALAIARVESNFDPLAIRFEARWVCFLKIEEFAKIARISEATEKTLQACSLGPMQVMGGVARELGHVKNLLELISTPELAIYYGVKKLKQCLRKYPVREMAIAAYNAGVPRRVSGGGFMNQKYVDKVMSVYRSIKLH